MDEKMRAATDMAGLVGYQAELKEKINAVSRRSLDGSVVMSSEEWNGIVELAEKLLAVAHPHNGEQGGEWVSVGERQTDAINHALDVLSKHGDAFTSIGAMQVLEEMLEPQPPKSKEGK